MNILYQKGNKLLSTWAFNFRTLRYMQMETKVIYLVAPSNDIKLLALPHDPHHHG